MKSNSGQLTRRYIFALGLIALLAILAYSTAQALLWSRQVSSTYVNVSGRQRMLTQRLGLLTLQYATSDEPEARLDIRDELVNTLRVFEASHISLRDGGIAPGFEESRAVILPTVSSTSLQNYFFEEPSALDARVMAFQNDIERLLQEDVAALDENHPLVQQILTNSSGELLNAQNGLVWLYQMEAETAVARFRQFEMALLLVTLTTLLLLGLFVFRPITAEIVEQTQALRNANETLRQQNELSLSQAQDMKLAAEVAQSVSELQDLDKLLLNAVEMIRSRFQLYYVQIYLINRKAQQLVLKAGTGDVGDLLVRSNFTLPLALNSLNGIAAVEKRFLIVNDVKTSPLYRPNKRLPRTKSEMVLPLMHRGSVIGVLDLQSSEANAFSTDKLGVFQTVSAQLSAAIQNARLFEALNERSEGEAVSLQERVQEGWNRYLNGLDQPRELVVSSAGDQEDGPLSEVAVQSFPLEVGGAKIGEVSLVGDQTTALSSDQMEIVRKVADMASGRLENLRLLAQAEKYRQEAEFATRRLTGEAWADFSDEQASKGYAFDLNRVIVNDGIEGGIEQSAYIKPFRIQGADVGHIALLDKEALTEEEEALLRAISEQISGHIENLRLTQQTEKALKETELYSQRLTALNDLSAEIATLESLDTISQIVANRTLDIVEADRVSITLLSADAPGKLTIVTQAGLSDDDTPQQQVDIEGSPMERSIETGQMSNGVFQVDDHQYEARFFPLFAEGRVLGTLNIASNRPNLFTTRNEQLIRQIASLTSATLESAILSDRTQYALYESNTLFELVAKLNEAATMGQILDVLVNSPVGDGFYIASYSRIDSEDQAGPKWLTLKEVRVGEGVAAPQLFSPIDQPQDIHAIEMMRPWLAEANNMLVLENIEQSELGAPEAIEQFVQHGYGAMVFIPLHIRDKWLGVVQIGWQEARHFSERDRRLLATVAEQASVVANQLYLLEETQKRAESLARITQLEVQLSQATQEEDFIKILHGVSEDASNLTLSYFDVSLDGDEYTLEDVVHWYQGQFQPVQGGRINLTSTHPIYNEWQTDSAQIILVPDVANDGRIDETARQYYLQKNIQSMVLLPLFSLGRWQGAISLWWTQRRLFSDEEIFIWNQVLDPLAASIASKRLLNETEQLYQIGSELNAAQHFTDVLEVLRTNTRAGREADLLNVFYFDQPWTDTSRPTRIDFVGSLERGKEVQSPLQKMPFSALPQLLVENRDEVQVIEHVITTSLLDEASRQLMLKTFRARTAIFVPIVVGGNWLGGVGLYYRQAQAFTQTDIQKLRPIGEQMSVVMQGIRFLRQAEVRAAREQQLREIATKVRSSTNVETIMRTAVQELGKAMGRQSVVYLESEADKAPEEKQQHSGG